MMFTITNETAADHSTIDSLLDRGFGASRSDLTVYRLRLAPPRPDLGFVARAGSGPVAPRRFWPVLVGETVPALLLGPLVVAPDQQGAGLGKRLVRHGVDQVTADGWKLCLVVGSPDYYARFGFEPAQPRELALPGPVDHERFQVRALGGESLPGLMRAEKKRGITIVQPWRSVRRRGMTRRATSRPLAA
jgi:predicted N-acetyltransferase YhbS